MREDAGMMNIPMRIGHAIGDRKSGMSPTNLRAAVIPIMMSRLSMTIAIGEIRGGASAG
jgi:hypothetical protein